MEFDYSVYWNQNCILCIIFSAFCSIFLGSCIVSLCKAIPKREEERIFIACIGIIICAYLLSVNLIPLFRGGFWLLFEKEDDAVAVTGTVDATEEIVFAVGKYEVANNHGRGEALVVDGVKYYLMSYGRTKVGDTVTLKVLPRSRIVLSLERSDLKNEPSE